MNNEGARVAFSLQFMLAESSNPYRAALGFLTAEMRLGISKRIRRNGRIGDKFLLNDGLRRRGRTGMASVRTMKMRQNCHSRVPVPVLFVPLNDREVSRCGIVKTSNPACIRSLLPADFGSMPTPTPRTMRPVLNGRRRYEQIGEFRQR